MDEKPSKSWDDRRREEWAWMKKVAIVVGITAVVLGVLMVLARLVAAPAICDTTPAKACTSDWQCVTMEGPDCCETVSVNHAFRLICQPDLSKRDKFQCATVCLEATPTCKEGRCTSETMKVTF